MTTRKQALTQDRPYALFWCIVLLIIVMITAGCATKDTPPPQEGSINLSCPNCNIILLNVELFRADYIDLISTEHGNNTPNIDRFFNNSIIFTDASAPAGSTIQSNIAVLTAENPFIINQILTKRYPGYNILLDKNVDYFTAYPTIIQLLNNEGYYTVNINEGGHTGRFTYMDKGVDNYIEESAYEMMGIKSARMFPAIARTITDLEKNESQKNKFFLLAHSNILHSSPYIYPLNRSRINSSLIRYIPIYETGQYMVFENISTGNRTPESYDSPGFHTWFEDYGSKFHDIPHWTTQKDNTQYKEITQQLYIQQVKYVDEEFGKIFDQLEENNMTDNTIIVLYANHGDGLFDNDVPVHDVEYQSCIHVPILIRHPRINKTIVVTTPVALIDLMPTIYHMVSEKEQNGTFATAGLADAMSAKNYTQKYIFGLSQNHGDEYVRDGDMKLLIQANNEKTLYNITADPHEEHNIAAQYPEKVKELDDLLITQEIESEKEYYRREGRDINLTAAQYEIMNDASFYHGYDKEHNDEIWYRWISGNHSVISLPDKYHGKTIEIHGGFFYCEKNQMRPQIRINGITVTAFPFNTTLNSTNITFESQKAMRPIDCTVSAKSDDTRYLAVYIDSNTRVIN